MLSNFKGHFFYFIRTTVHLTLQAQFSSLKHAFLTSGVKILFQNVKQKYADNKAQTQLILPTFQREKLSDISILAVKSSS